MDKQIIHHYPTCTKACHVNLQNLLLIIVISTRDTYFKFRRRRVAYSRGALIPGGRLFNFSQIVAWHDHFFNTSSPCKHQHKLFIDLKSWS